MSESAKEPTAYVHDAVRDIVARGQNVRQQVSRVVAETVQRFHLNPEGLIGLARSALDGATAAVDRAVPHSPDSVLRQVVDGLGDGFSTAALGSKLALEEAEAESKSFASEDLAKLRADFKALGELFVDTVSRTAGRLKTFATAEQAALREHAEQARKRLQPALESALSAASKHPIQLGKESVGAGLNLSRQALGALFSTVGRTMDRAGKKLAGEEPTK